MNTTKILGALIATAALFSLPGMALAHPEHDDETPKVKEVQAHVVLSATKGGATLRVTKDGKAVSTKGASGTLTLLDGDKPTELALKPASDGTMAVTSQKAIASNARAKVAITFADKTTLSTDVVAK